MFGTGDDITTIPDQVTDGTGSYAFIGLPPGKYRVNLDDTDLPTALTGTTTVDPRTITLVGGAGFDGADFGYYEPITIGDFIWEDLNGNGIQDDGASSGLGGISVELFNGLGVSQGTTTTLGDGSYSFPNLAPGSYYIEVALGAYSATTQNAGGDDTLDSDLDPTGRSDTFVLASGSDGSVIDGGLFVPTPVLEVTKSASPDPVLPGADITYTIDYANTGNAGATGVVLTETVPHTHHLQSHRFVGVGVFPGRQRRLDMHAERSGTLAAGATGTAAFVVTVDPTVPLTSTQISNTVVIDGDGGLTDSASTLTDVDANPDLVVLKADVPLLGGLVDPTGTVEPGESFRYSVTIDNTAGTAAATGVVFTDTPGRTRRW